MKASLKIQNIASVIIKFPWQTETSSDLLIMLCSRRKQGDCGGYDKMAQGKKGLFWLTEGPVRHSRGLGLRQQSSKQLATLSSYLESRVDEGMWAIARFAFSFSLRVDPGPQPMGRCLMLVSSAILGPDLSAWQWWVFVITEVLSLLPSSLPFTVYQVHLLSFFKQRNSAWHGLGVALPSLLVLVKDVSLSPGHFLMYRIKMKYLLLYSYYNGKKCSVCHLRLFQFRMRNAILNAKEIFIAKIYKYSKIFTKANLLLSQIVLSHYQDPVSHLPPTFLLRPSPSFSVSPQFCSFYTSYLGRHFCDRWCPLLDFS